jgi:hypothetical protein
LVNPFQDAFLSSLFDQARSVSALSKRAVVFQQHRLRRPSTYRQLSRNELCGLASDFNRQCADGVASWRTRLM